MEQSADDLMLNLNQYSVVGVCDPSSSMFFSTSDMASDAWPLYFTKACELNSSKHQKRSLWLLQDCSVKLFKQEAQSSTTESLLSSSSSSDHRGHQELDPSSDHCSATTDEHKFSSLLTKIQNMFNTRRKISQTVAAS